MAGGAIGVAPGGYGVELHGEGVGDEQTVGEQLPHPGKKLHRLGGLEAAEHSHHGTHHAGNGARCVGLGGRGIGEHTAVACLTGHAGEQLSAKLIHTTHGERLALSHASIVDHIFRAQRVGAVDDEVIVGYHIVD